MTYLLSLYQFKVIGLIISNKTNPLDAFPRVKFQIDLDKLSQLPIIPLNMFTHDHYHDFKLKIVYKDPSFVF
jgi:hypothetical protein